MAAEPVLALCPVCKRTVSVTKASTICAHGVPGDRCPGGGTRVASGPLEHQAVIEMLAEVKRMKRRRTP